MLGEQRGGCHPQLSRMGDWAAAAAVSKLQCGGGAQLKGKVMTMTFTEKLPQVRPYNTFYKYTVYFNNPSTVCRRCCLPLSQVDFNTTSY